MSVRFQEASERIIYFENERETSRTLSAAANLKRVGIYFAGRKFRADRMSINFCLFLNSRRAVLRQFPRFGELVFRAITRPTPATHDPQPSNNSPLRGSRTQAQYSFANSQLRASPHPHPHPHQPTQPRTTQPKIPHQFETHPHATQPANQNLS